MDIYGGSLRGTQVGNNFTLEPATTEALGGIKSGGDIEVDADGIVTVKKVNGNAPSTTPTEINAADITTDATHRFVTDDEKAGYDAKETTEGSQAKADKALNDAKAYTDTKVADLVGTTPETLDTLNELAAALDNDANFATTVTTELSKKASSDHNHDDVYQKVFKIASLTIPSTAWVANADNTGYVASNLEVTGAIENALIFVTPADGVTRDQLEMLQDANIQVQSIAENTISLVAYGVCPTANISVKFVIFAQ